MSLLNEYGVEVRSGFQPSSAPPLPGDGPIVYMQSAGDLLMVARHAPGDVLCNVWSWVVGDDHWDRCHLA